MFLPLDPGDRDRLLISKLQVSATEATSDGSELLKPTTNALLISAYAGTTGSDPRSSLEGSHSVILVWRIRWTEGGKLGHETRRRDNDFQALDINL